MQAKSRRPEEKFIKASASHHCPICGKSDWCGFNSYIASCMRIEEGSFRTVIQSNGKPAYLHWLEPGRVTLPAVQDEDSITAASTASVEVRDRVYRDFLSLLYLNQRHKEDLLRRGLSEYEIRKNCYRSVPEKETPWFLCRRLNNMGHDLVGIPGFYKACSPHGGTYWTFNRQPGYFIPVRDEKGNLQALQCRMDETRNGKYRLFSGHKNWGGCSCGTPTHVSRPVWLKDRRVWITEGPLKSDIACNYLGAVVLGAMSAGTWKPVIPIIKKIGATEVVIAYDRDLDTNHEVGRVFELLKDDLKKNGFAVGRALWKGSEKGIDDALVKGMKIKVLEER